MVALSTLSDGQAAVVDAAGEKLVRAGPAGDVTRFDLAHDPDEEHGTPATDDVRRAGEARIATYEQLASSGWDSHHLDDAAGALAFDGRALAARWAPGPCVTTRLTADGDLRVEPAGGGFCAATSDPFERRLGRAFADQALAAGFALRLTLGLDAHALDTAHPPRVLAKVWGHDETFVLPLDPRADGLQTVTLALPGPPEDRRGHEAMVAVVGVDPPAPYVLHQITIVPGGGASVASPQKNAQ